MFQLISTCTNRNYIYTTYLEFPLNTFQHFLDLWDLTLIVCFQLDEFVSYLKKICYVVTWDSVHQSLKVHFDNAKYHDKFVRLQTYTCTLGYKFISYLNKYIRYMYEDNESMLIKFSIHAKGFQRKAFKFCYESHDRHKKLGA